jgi:hypothetical protein
MTRAEGLDELVLVALHRAGEPVREAVLYERVRSAAPMRLSPETFLASLDRLVTLRRAQVHIDHELPVRDPEPFSPRYYAARE